MVGNVNKQMQVLIEEAIREVSVKGREARVSDIILAGFGYLADEVNRPQWWSIKRVVPIAFAAGAATATGAITAILRWLGYLP